MNMHQGIGAMDVVVFLSVAFAVAFTAAWSLSPALRTWIERPKYRFLENLRRYDKEPR